jgi:lysophospholipase L1-like esterase
MVWPTANARASAEQKILHFFNERMPRLADLAVEYYDQLAPRFGALQLALQEREFAGKPESVAVCDGSRWLLARTDDYYFDPMHFNDRGQREVAVLLCAEMAKRGWLQ